MTDTDQKIRDRLIAAYSSLSPFEQILLQLLSVVYEPVTRTTILNCLRRAGLKGPKGHWLILPTITPYLLKLQKLELIDEQNRCHAAIVEMLSTEAVAKGLFADIAAAVRAELPQTNYHGKKSQKCLRLIRELRSAIYANDIGQIDDALTLLTPLCDNVIDTGYHVVSICTNPFQPAWFSTLPASFQLYLLDQILGFAVKDLQPFDAVALYLENEEEHRLIPEQERLPFHRLLAQYLLWRGDLPRLRRLLERHPRSFAGSGLEACLDFITGDNDLALQRFGDDLAMLQEITGRRSYFYNISGLFYILALLKANDASRLDTILELIRTVRTQKCDSMLMKIYTLLEVVVLAQKNHVVAAEALLSDTSHQGHGIIQLFYALANYWMNGEVENTLVEQLTASFDKARPHGFLWLSFEYAELLHALDVEPFADIVSDLRRETGFTSIVKVAKIQESWKRSLEALISLTANGQEEQEQNGTQTRMVWVIGFENSAVTVTPKEQKLTAAGEWSRGRPIALNRLYEERYKLDFLSEQDWRICNAIRREQTPLSTVYNLDLDAALPAMIGHPLLLEDSSSEPVEFVKGEPELLVDMTGEWLRLSLMTDVGGNGVTVVRESPNRFKIFDMTEKLRRILKTISAEGLQIPAKERDRVLAVLGNISSYMTVHSAIGGRSPSTAEVAADAGIFLQLLPLGSGFRLEMFVKPFRTGGPYLKPGQGTDVVMAEVNGRRLQTRRDLQLEEENGVKVEAACPTLAEHDHLNRTWYFQEMDDCLQVIMEIQAIKDMVTVEWPAGEKLTVNRQVSCDQVHLKISKKRNWFEVSGQLEIDASRLLDMKNLLLLVEQSGKRFIPLGEGQFLALTRELHRRLIELNALAGKSAEGGGEEAIRIHPLAAPVLAEITADFSHSAVGRGWRQQLQLIEDARQLAPILPAALQATLRDYQRQGYEWLARLAHWGLGACLADDMGLGKTMQALAIILARAVNGPTLVVAPTSVSMNWQAETERFAPTLNIVTLDSKDRGSTIQGLKPNDILITSYTLLQQEAELLATVEWETIVLDEAQAIKNTATKRSHAAMALTGKFKLLTTGTPIENHLGELWNLFRFITPGLLGSLDQFNERFAIPIERKQSQAARQKLKKLIQPFILRRTKDQVLHELPPRTDVLLHVALNEDETAFYEALRRQALENLNKFSVTSGSNQQAAKMQILAEITRLRRACCNPRLVAPGVAIASSKLKLFGRIVRDLKENNHKILVFSQFVGHLALIREFLDENGFIYRYLDGSTPARERQREVENFQAGQGDLFLISLKAGGLGLNLTAADYVIHMDPWWNPAVEDQASDRAHRIGQTLPVTIYRLVAKNTIEEKIINLHKKKRLLASRLLDGSDVSARISAEELLNLLREF